MTTPEHFPQALPIALVAPYEKLGHTAEELIGRHHFPARVAVGDLEEGMAAGRALMEQGAEIFVSRGGTAKRLKELGLPVVEIKVTAYDILSALERIGPAGRRVAVVAFDNVIAGVSRLNPFFGHEVKVFPIAGEQEARAKVQAAKAEGVDMVLGDMVVHTQAKALGLHAVLIESGPEALVDALLEAVERLTLIRAEARKGRQRAEVLSLFKSVFETAEDLILIKGKDGSIESLAPEARMLLQDSLQNLTLDNAPPPPGVKRMKKSQGQRLTPLRRRELAKRMGISRTTLWRRLKLLE